MAFATIMKRHARNIKRSPNFAMKGSGDLGGSLFSIVFTPAIRPVTLTRSLYAPTSATSVN